MHMISRLWKRLNIELELSINQGQTDPYSIFYHKSYIDDYGMLLRNSLGIWCLYIGAISCHHK